jgi:hypothetical protein
VSSNSWSWRAFHHPQSLGLFSSFRTGSSVFYMAQLLFSYLSVYTNSVSWRIHFTVLLGGGTHFMFPYFKSYLKLYITHGKILVWCEFYYIIILISCLYNRDASKEDGLSICYQAEVMDYTVHEVRMDEYHMHT